MILSLMPRKNTRAADLRFIQRLPDMVKSHINTQSITWSNERK